MRDKEKQIEMENEQNKTDAANEQPETELEHSDNQQVQQDDSYMQEQLAQLNDKYLRMWAEYDNYKKRTQKEKADIYSAATADVITAILPVLDTISRAAQMEGDSEGINLIKKQLDDVLKDIGVEQISTVGEQFDPQWHNAVLHIEDESLDSNTIVEELATGYKYKDKVIRYSMVKVAN